MTPLSGKSVVITRPRDKADAFASALQALGAQVVFFPTIHIAPLKDTATLDRALTRLACYDWMVLTSASAVDAVWSRLKALGINKLPDTLQIAAVGPKTAAALGDQGARPDFVPAEYTGEAILPGLGELRGRWVLLPLADIAHKTLPDAICDSGGVPHVITAYYTVPASPDLNGIQALRSGVDVVTFTSGSTARNFVTLVQNAGLDPFDLPGDPMISCIGPKTAKAVREVGLRVDIVAQEYTVEGLIAGIQRHMLSLSTEP